MCEKGPGKPIFYSINNEVKLKFSHWVSVDRAEHVVHVIEREEWLNSTSCDHKVSISLLQEAWNALSSNQVLVTLHCAENYTLPDEFRKKIFYLNSKLNNFYFEIDVIFFDNIFCFTFDRLCCKYILWTGAYPCFSGVKWL